MAMRIFFYVRKLRGKGMYRISGDGPGVKP
jgi:hypothetical protein